MFKSASIPPFPRPPIRSDSVVPSLSAGNRLTPPIKIQNTMNVKSYLLTLLLGVGICGTAQASIVLTDTFADNDRTANPAWYSLGSPTIGQANGILAMGGPANGHRYLYTHFTGVTLASVGDQLAFSFRVRLTGDQANRNSEVSFAVGNNGGTFITTDGNTFTTYNNDLGYIAGIGLGTGTSSIIRDAGTSNWLGRVFDGADQTTLSAATAGMALTGSFKDYTLTFERTASGLDIQLSDGTTSIALSDNAVPSQDFYTFNTIAFGYYNRNVANSLDVDSLSLSYSAIPEPATTAMLMAGALLGIAGLRRRRQR